MDVETAIRARRTPWLSHEEEGHAAPGVRAAARVAGLPHLGDALGGRRHDRPVPARPAATTTAFLDRC